MDYKNGKIYKVLNTVNSDCYIGSTCSKLSQRMAKHRYDMKSSRSSDYKIYQRMRELGIENFYIELLCECPCDNKEQLQAMEGQYIRKLGTLNDRIAGRSNQEYRETHKEENKERCKKYREENPEKVSESKKKCYDKKPEQYKKHHQEYRQRDDVIQRRKLKIICSCGCEVRKEDIRRHERTKKHQEALNNLSNSNNVPLQSDNLRETGEATEGEEV